MGILSGCKKFKKYLRTADGYQLCSEWTNADSVEMADGSTLQESVSSLNEEVASLNEDITSLNGNLADSLGGITFGVDADGNYGYKKAGADTVIPFKSGGSLKKTNSAMISNPIQNGSSSTTMQYDETAVVLFIKAIGWDVTTGTGHFIDLSTLTKTTSYSMFFQATWGDETTYTVTINPTTRTVTCNAGAMGSVYTTVAAYTIA